MAITAAVDNASETTGDLNKEAWDKYNLLRLAVLVEHDTDGTHLSTGDVVLKALFDANTILVANSDDTPAALTIAANRILGRASTGNIAALTAAQVNTILSTATRALDNLASVAINTSLISDTDDTDDLGSAAKQWKDLYIDGTANIDSLIADTADINGGTINDITRLTIISTSETTAANAAWIDFRSTVTSGDLTGIRSRVYSNAASAGPNVRGGYLEAKMGAASKFAAMLEGALLHADYSAGSATISGDVRGFTAHISQGAGLNAANLFGGLINIQTRGDETITTDDIGLMIRNEAVGGSGRTMDAGLKITDLNMGGGTNGFTYGIDLNGVGITTADIRFSGGQVIASSATALTIPAFTLSGKLTAGASEIEGSNFDINGGTINGITDLAVADGGTGASDATNARSNLGLVIGTNVLAQQAIGIANDNLIEVDHVSPADDDYAKFTVNGLEGRSYTEVRTDINVENGATADQTEAEILTLLGLTSVEVDQVGNIAATTISEAQWGYLGACGAGGGQLLAGLTTGESTQLELIGDTTISAAQWGYLGGSSGIDHYVDRGDPATYDFTEATLTTDGTWNDLNLSAIVPAGAVAVHFYLQIKDDAVSSYLLFRKNGNAEDVNIAGFRTQVADVWFEGNFVVACDSNRVIEHKGANLAFTNINLAVKGWWIP